MEFISLANSLGSISMALLVIAPTIFIFSVTLLGTAIDKSQQEEKAARENDKENLKKEIDEIEASLKEARQNGDAQTLTTKLEGLKEKQTKLGKKIDKIKTKYSSIDLNNGVIYPCGAFFLAYLSGYLVELFKNEKFFILLILIFSITLLILYGLIKIYKSLWLIQQISANKKESEIFSNLKQSIKLALQEHEQDKKGEVSIEFVEKAFPLNIPPLTELDINFRVKLSKGSILQNANIWFFVPDGFDLINPDEKSAWKQGPDYDPPNIRTVKIQLDNLSVGPYKSRTLKVRTPLNPGKYLLRYKVYADGFYGPLKDLSILVG